MKRKGPIFLLFSVLIFGILGLWLLTRPLILPENKPAQSVNPSPHLKTPPSSPQVSLPPIFGPNNTVSQLDRVRGFFATPITFYGKVVDQHGVSIPSAQVQAAASISMGGGSAKINVLSDDDGLFTIQTKGLSLFVSVSKAGYYHIPQESLPNARSEGGFDYGSNLGRGIHQASRTAPVVFTLFKRGAAETLIRLNRRNVILKKDGTPATVLLEADNAAKHQLILRCWTNDTEKDAKGHYSWRFEVSVPGGGLIVASDRYGFIAPQEGYVDQDAIDMSKSLEKGVWRRSIERSYFVKFGDGIFARLSVEMIAGGDHFASVTGYVNPKSGSRVLEVDPNQR